MLLKDIKFPIFAIGSYSKFWSENNILYLQSDSDIIYKIDNKNLPFETIGKRRLFIKQKERYKFVGTYFTIAQMVRSNKKLFVDSNGKVIKYKKTQRVPLIYREIISRKSIEGKGYLIRVKGITAPFLLSASIYNCQKFIGLLNYNDDYLIYELSNEKKADTWRKI